MSGSFRAAVSEPGLKIDSIPSATMCVYLLGTHHVTLRREGLPQRCLPVLSIQLFACMPRHYQIIATQGSVLAIAGEGLPSCTRRVVQRLPGGLPSLQARLKP